MEQTLRDLGEILQKATVTIALLIVLFWYLKVMLYGPLEKTLKQRNDLTEGSRKAAADSLAAADRKTSDYEAQLRDARSELYKEQEELRRQLMNEQASQLAQARERNSAQVQRAKQQITAEATAARDGLEASVGVLADQIASAVLAPGGRR